MTGSWNMVESYSGDIDYKVEQRTINESSSSMSKTEATEYSISVTASFEFFGFG